MGFLKSFVYNWIHNSILCKCRFRKKYIYITHAEDIFADFKLFFNQISYHDLNACENGSGFTPAFTLERFVDPRKPTVSLTNKPYYRTACFFAKILSTSLI